MTKFMSLLAIAAMFAFTSCNSTPATEEVTEEVAPIEEVAPVVEAPVATDSTVVAQ